MAMTLEEIKQQAQAGNVIKSEMIRVLSDTATAYNVSITTNANNISTLTTRTNALSASSTSLSASMISLSNLNSVVGLAWNKTTDVYTRLGLASGKTQTFFDNIAPFNQMRRCNLSDSGVVTAYYGESSYIEDGSNGQVMVEIPKFWYRVNITDAGYEWYVSPIEQSGFNLHPAFIKNSVKLDYIYFSAYEGSIYDSSPTAIEVNTITITNSATADGNLSLTLDGDYDFTVAVVNGDTVENVVDKIVAAGNKTDYSGVLWTVAKVDASNLTYTASSAGIKKTITMPDAHGVTSSIAKTTPGAGGYVLNDAPITSASITAGTSILSSVTGTKPFSGWNSTTASIISFRQAARNRGSGWEQQDFVSSCAIQLLMLIEYGTFRMQTALSEGVTNITDDVLTNMAIKTGRTITLGNSSGQVSTTHYKTSQTTYPFSYRGIENFYGNIWKFVDGINIQGNNILWVADNAYVSDTYGSPYVNTGLALFNSSGWVKDIKVNNKYKYQFLCSLTGGDSATYISDYYYQATKNGIALLGGGWYHGLFAGSFDWSLAHASGAVHRAFGGRVLFR